MSASKSSRGRLTVFEASNARRRESFIGTTKLPMHALAARFESELPPELSRWRAGDAVSYRSLEFFLTAAKAAAFIRGYASRRAGWRTIKEGAGAPRASR